MSTPTYIDHHGEPISVIASCIRKQESCLFLIRKENIEYKSFNISYVQKITKMRKLSLKEIRNKALILLQARVRVTKKITQLARSKKKLNYQIFQMFKENECR